MINLIVSQGRVADRAPRMIEGAARTARALQQRYGCSIQSVGVPQPHAHDDWRDSLPQARDTLLGLRDAIDRSLRRDPLTVMLSNTCSASLASLPRVAQSMPEAVVLWIDAHGDFNTPATTGSGYLGGMVLAGACGLWDSGHGAGLRPHQVMLVGARDIDPPEQALLTQAGVRILPPAQVTPEAVLAAIGTAPVWVHIDWDVLDPGHLPADYSVPEGLHPAQIRALFEAIPAGQLRGIELAEFNASLDEQVNAAALDVILDIVAPVFERHSAR
ncbi:arginase family protein [Roseateles terrae]|uniref:Arginase/N-omega-hydroxy-L-arginine amidinohydrolase n=1 Tax=Roseateles terrae TaxID=431060 RepID=A0ABR6GN04_9BURK|nr:arginase family protein [Roseateles terrae]MBB3193462.1 arginase/N-omega-hydroxy-L-arginine amidinohydrolase [Roseateles terrae]OWQ89356.1 arginase [Roseateles terrae]